MWLIFGRDRRLPHKNQMHTFANCNLFVQLQHVHAHYSILYRTVWWHRINIRGLCVALIIWCDRAVAVSAARGLLLFYKKKKKMYVPIQILTTLVNRYVQEMFRWICIYRHYKHCATTNCITRLSRHKTA